MTDPVAQPPVAESRAPFDRIVLLAAVALGLLHLVLLPPWMGEDEPWHVEYLHYVAAGHSPVEPARAWTADDLAEHSAGVLWAHDHISSLSYEEVEAYQRDVLASMREHRFSERVDLDPRHAEPRAFDDVQPEDPHFTAFGQPRLYYRVAGALVALSGASTPAAELAVARGLSFVCYLVTVWLALLLARLVFEDERAVLLAAAVALLFPMHARQAAVVNNDVLAKALSAGVLFFAARFALGRSGMAAFVAAAVCLTLGLFVKTTAAGGLAVVAAAVVLRRFTPRVDGARADAVASRARMLVLLGAVALISAVAVYYWLYSASPAVPKTLLKFRENLRDVASLHSLLELWGSTVGTTSWNTRLLPDALYVVVGVGAVLAMASCAFVALGRWEWIRRPGLLLCLVAIAAQLAILVLRGKALGRYWMPVLPAFGVAFAAGVLGPFDERWRTRLTWAAVAALVLYEGWFLWGALVVNHYVVWGS